MRKKEKLIKDSVVTKLFLITTSLFMLLFTVQFITQDVFLSRFYKNIKIDMVTKKIEELVSELEKLDLNDEELLEKLALFTLKEEIDIAIVDEYGIPTLPVRERELTPHLEVVNEKGEKYYVIQESTEEYQRLLEKLKVGMTINVEGQRYPDLYEFNGLSSGKWLYPTVIHLSGEKFDIYKQEKIDEMYSNEELAPYDGGDVTVESAMPDLIYENGESITGGDFYSPENVSVTGKVTDIHNVIGQDQLYYRSQIMDAKIQEILYKYNFENYLSEQDQAKWYEGKDLTTGMDDLLVTKGFKYKSKEYILFGYTSLQPVNDAAEIIKIVYIYFFIFGLLMVILISFIYIRVLAKPLIHVKNVAGKMASMDFSTKCEVKSKDEIGQLAVSLNELSNSLKINMEELKQANAKLEMDIEKERKQEETRKELIANMSHELKTPLAVIEGILSGMRDGIYDKDDLQHIASVIEEISGMNGLIYEMLELSKIESDAYKIQPEIFDLSNSVLRIHNQMKMMCEEKQLKVLLHVDEIPVIGDKKKIEQVIKNLYCNAIRYTEPQNIIEISILEEDNTVVFNIENHGAHINEEEIEEIWKAFYRIDKSRSRQLGGTGLGLQIVKGILEHHDSQYGVKNTSKGVLFHFSLEKADVNQ